MNPSIKLCLVLHNHQPIGNFDGVIEQAYRDSYLPFLQVFEPFADLRIALHTSGPLMLWLAEHHPEYLERLRGLVTAGRIEIVGGAFYEPILTMLPSRDRIGQIARYRDWLQNRFDTDVVGMWMPERVWESQLIRDLVPSGVQYTVLDDFHFRAAGWTNDQLTGYFLTEDDGQVLRVFPGSEKLRYLIPFGKAEQTIEYAREIAKVSPGSTLVFGDDGEKFGTWPETRMHVYDNGWLAGFFEALNANRDWLVTTTPADVIRTVPPAGKIYLPDCSYREMTEWALPVSQQAAYDEVVHHLQEDVNWPTIQRFVRGGYWRNFRVKYSEANEMYCRMQEVSERLENARKTAPDAALLPQAEDHLYRGQCNCPYWHGAFGGIYLPHLRNATYRELIAADNLLERANGRKGAWIDATTDDFDNDLSPEVRLANDHLIAYVAPARGGIVYELDVREMQHNLLATIQRRPEYYHAKVLAGNRQIASETASIHDRVVFKQAGLEKRLQYDTFPKKSMLDHFFDNDVVLEDVVSGRAIERGDFVAMPFEAKLRRGTGKIQIQLRRDGNVWGVPISLTKALTMEAGQNSLAITYLMEGLPPGRPFHFVTEWNFAGMPSGADDRFFYDSQGTRLGQLGTHIDFKNASFIGLIDQWLGVDVQLSLSRQAGIWAMPIETVSQSEAGFELVHQSVCVMPHMIVQGDVEGKWTLQMQIRISASHEPVLESTEVLHAVV